jgi:hypothetical protein
VRDQSNTITSDISGCYKGNMHEIAVQEINNPPGIIYGGSALTAWLYAPFGKLRVPFGMGLWL